MTKAQQLALIKEAYYDLPDMVDGFRDVAEYLSNMNEVSERAHRKGKGPYHCSVCTAARYFTVKDLLEGWFNPEQYTIDDIARIRNGALYAQAYAKRFHKGLVQWAVKYHQPFSLVDYCDIIK